MPARSSFDAGAMESVAPVSTRKSASYFLRLFWVARNVTVTWIRPMGTYFLCGWLLHVITRRDGMEEAAPSLIRDETLSIIDNQFVRLTTGGDFHDRQ